MTGTKATYLEEKCREWGHAFVRFDYFGHGASEGDFVEGTLGRWLNNVVQVIDELTTGPQILVGSSMGGWLMLLAALARPERLQGLVGIAAAPDFLDDFSRLTPEQAAALEETGICYFPSGIEGKPYPIARTLITEAKQHNLLHQPIAIDCPVRLLHGLLDVEVHWKKSLKIAECLRTKDVNITFVKEGDHRLSSPEQLTLLAETVKSVLCLPHVNRM
jgi:pimeloyl-ACP methyl ester carboxylesterase